MNGTADEIYRKSTADPLKSQSRQGLEAEITEFFNPTKNQDEPPKQTLGTLSIPPKSLPPLLAKHQTPTTYTAKPSRSSTPKSPRRQVKPL